MGTANTWDSYSKTLETFIDIFKPKIVLEYGSGKSTEYFCKKCESVDTVEHNPKWYNRILPRDNLCRYLVEDPVLYPFCCGRYNKFDLIFVDGIEREKCLEQAKRVLNKEGIVILHDAERESYQEAIRHYPYFVFTDNGHTCVMATDALVGEKAALIARFNKL